MLSTKRKLTFCLAQNRRAIHLCKVRSLPKTCLNERPPRPTYRWAEGMRQASEKSTLRSSRTRRQLEILDILSWLLKGFFKTKLYVDSIHLFEKAYFSCQLPKWMMLGHFSSNKKGPWEILLLSGQLVCFYLMDTVNFLTDLILW